MPGQAGSLFYVVLTLRGSFPEPVAERRDYAEQAGSLSYEVPSWQNSPRKQFMQPS